MRKNEDKNKKSKLYNLEEKKEKKKGLNYSKSRRNEDLPKIK